MEVQLQGAISDLHAADTRYHDDCRTNFMDPRSVLTASGSSKQCGSRGTALEQVMQVMTSDKHAPGHSQRYLKCTRIMVVLFFLSVH